MGLVIPKRCAASITFRGVTFSINRIGTLLIERENASMMLTSPLVFQVKLLGRHVPFISGLSSIMSSGLMPYSIAARKMNILKAEPG